MRTLKTLLAALCLILGLGLLQGCEGMEVKPPSEFGYQRNWHPPA
jgi:hypothetical protein